ncbi:MAG: GNAT family N-acetyltransferase [Polyangiaceae bacterium]
MPRSSRDTVVLRERVRTADRAAVRALVSDTDMFDGEEVDVAEELVEAYLERGPESGYRFVFAEVGRKLLGYVCYGPVPGSDRRFEIYWIAVAREAQGRGMGRRLMLETERRIHAEGGVRAYAETASRPQYLPTRRFYVAMGYRKLGSLPHYYRRGDGKITYVKDLGRTR